MSGGKEGVRGMNNNKLNQTALEARCKGVFSTNGYLNAGTEYASSDMAANLVTRKLL